MKAALYARVSTEDQAKNCSIPSQLESMHEFAVGHGFEVVKEFVDEGISGAVLGRPALSELRECARQSMVEAVIVYDPDRLSRKLVHLMVLVDEFERHGVELKFVTQSVGQSPEDRMLFGMKGIFAEYERTKLLERTARGKLRKAKEGKQPGGQPPYGYKLVDSRHVIEPKEADVVRMVFDWLVKDGMKLRTIQQRLIRLVIPTRKGKAWWQRSTLYRIVTDETYAGRWYYNKHVDAPAKTKDGGTVQILKPREQWIPVEVPAIISREAFEAAQRQLSKNRELCSRNTKSEYLLSGLLVCGNCGYKLGARTTGGRTYYCCSSKSGNNRPKSCFAKNIRADRLETVVWDTISHLLSQPRLIIEQVRNQGQDPTDAYLEANLDRVSQVLERKEIEADRMLDAYKIGAIDLPTLKRKMDAIKSEKARLSEEQARLEGELRKCEAQELNDEKLHQFCQSLPTTLTTLDFGDKRQILREVVDRIVVAGDELSIYGIIPAPEDKAKDVLVELPSS